jgi:hypothetical protein
MILNFKKGFGKRWLRLFLRETEAKHAKSRNEICWLLRSEPDQWRELRAVWGQGEWRIPRTKFSNTEAERHCNTDQYQLSSLLFLCQSVLPSSLLHPGPCEEVYISFHLLDVGAVPWMKDRLIATPPTWNITETRHICNHAPTGLEPAIPGTVPRTVSLGPLLLATYTEL